MDVYTGKLSPKDTEGDNTKQNEPNVPIHVKSTADVEDGLFKTADDHAKGLDWAAAVAAAKKENGHAAGKGDSSAKVHDIWEKEPVGNVHMGKSAAVTGLFKSPDQYLKEENWAVAAADAANDLENAVGRATGAPLSTGYDAGTHSAGNLRNYII